MKTLHNPSFFCFLRSNQVESARLLFSTSKHLQRAQNDDGSDARFPQRDGHVQPSLNDVLLAPASATSSCVLCCVSHTLETSDPTFAIFFCCLPSLQSILVLPLSSFANPRPAERDQCSYLFVVSSSFGRIEVMY